MDRIKGFVNRVDELEQESRHIKYGLLVISVVIIAAMTYVIWRYMDQKMVTSMAAGTIALTLPVLAIALRLLWRDSRFSWPR